MCMLSGMKWEVVHSRSGAEVFGGTDFPAGCIRFEHELEAGIWKQRLLVYLQEDENLSYSAGRPESHTKRHLEVVTIFLSSSIATAVRTLADYFVQCVQCLPHRSNEFYQPCCVLRIRWAEPSLYHPLQRYAVQPVRS